MAVLIREQFVDLWRPVFTEDSPREEAVQAAWTRTRALLDERYGPRLTDAQARHLINELVVAWLLRALSPSASVADGELSTLAQQAALWLGLLDVDLDHIFSGYFNELQRWGIFSSRQD